MKRVYILVLFLLCTLIINAGDLVTRPYKSAAWVRMPSRNAATGIDAATYNPAGLIRSENGFYFSISNISVSNNYKIDNSYSGSGGNFPLNDSRYFGSGREFFSPAFYAVWKKNRLAFSLGFNTIGGTGTTFYNNGVPSFELNHPDLIPFLPASTGATAYESEIYLKAENSMKGLQGGFSYKINKMISVSAGFRYVAALTTRRGHIAGIRVNVSPGIWNRADFVIDNIVSRANNAFLGSSGNRGTTDLVSAGLGTLTLSQVPLLYIPQTRKEELEGALEAFGCQRNTLIAEADVFFRTVADKYFSASEEFNDIHIYDYLTGKGFTPVFSINISPDKNLNIALKYEMPTKIEMSDPGHSVETRNDLPAQFSAGLEYIISKNLKISFGSDYYFDKSASYGHLIDKNGLSVHTGVEYLLTKKMLLSGGYLFSNKGVNDKYQSDLNYGLSYHHFGIGGEYSLSKIISVNIGAGYTIFNSDSKTIQHPLFGTGEVLNATETYSQKRLILAAGIDFRF